MLLLISSGNADDSEEASHSGGGGGIDSGMRSVEEIEVVRWIEREGALENHLPPTLLHILKNLDLTRTF